MGVTVQVPVMVTANIVGEERLNSYTWPDSNEVAEVVQQLVASSRSHSWTAWHVVSVDGVASDPDDPNSPPVPASPTDG